MMILKYCKFKTAAKVVQIHQKTKYLSSFLFLLKKMLSLSPK